MHDVSTDLAPKVLLEKAKVVQDGPNEEISTLWRTCTRPLIQVDTQNMVPKSQLVRKNDHAKSGTQ
jgi:hypothetical protein